MNLSRRRLLQLALATGTAATTGYGVVVYRRRRRWHVYSAAELAEHLRETFDYLRPDAAGVDRFVKEYLQHHNAAPQLRALEHVETTFLLSTDFFTSGQPAAGPIRFARLYHPYVNPCYNPLRRAQA